MITVPMTPNRHSLFLAQQQDLHLWTLKTPALRFLQPVRMSIFYATVTQLIEENDGLQIQFTEDDPQELKQIVVQETIDSYTQRVEFHSCSADDDICAQLETAVQSIERQFKFPGPLFKAILLSDLRSNEHYLVILIHHALADRIAMQLITNRFFELYESSEKSIRPLSQLQRLGYKEYIERFMKHSEERMEEYCSYWEGLDWKVISGNFIGIDKFHRPEAGLQRDSDAVRFCIKVQAETTLSTDVAVLTGYTLIELILLCVSCAYIEVWGRHGIYIALAHHNRDRLEKGIEVRNVIGWLSTTFPLFLTPRHFSIEGLDAIRKALSDAESFGNGFGFVKYGAFGKPPSSVCVEPSFSLNYVEPIHAGFNYRGISANDAGCKKFPQPLTMAKRQYLVSGGAMVSGDSLTLEWDYSPFAINGAEVYNFANTCRKFLLLALNDLGFDAQGSPIGTANLA